MMKRCFVLLLAVFTFGRLLAGEPATAVATITAGFVSGITVTSGGSGYTSEPAVTLTGGGGSGATAKAVVAGDRVSLLIILTAGTGYLSTPQVIIEPPVDGPSIAIELIPRLTIRGITNETALIAFSDNLNGPWISWTNIQIVGNGISIIDALHTYSNRYYRVFKSIPVVPDGFKWIPPGTFLMGSPATEIGRDPDENEHRVTLSKGFWMSDHEVTQFEFEQVMGRNPSNWTGTNRPVERVTYEDALSYCSKLTKRERGIGRITQQEEYRLPTESEWEYAVRAGTSGIRYGDLDSIAWYDGNSQNETHIVKSNQPNAWGIYDMLGNVWEWCSDWYGDYPLEPSTDPQGPPKWVLPGTRRVIRGGSIFFGPEVCRSAYRDWLEYSAPNDDVGFRVILTSVR
jgi:hypothetical protein